MNKESKEIIRKELQELGSSLKGYNGNAEAGVPQDYFETFPQAVNQRIKGKQQEPTSWYFRLSTSRLIPVVASVALIVVVVFGFFIIESGKDQGYFTESDAALYDEYFSFVSDYDHSLYYEVGALDNHPDNNGLLPANNLNPLDPESEQMIKYVLDMAEYYGLNTRELIAIQD